MWILDGRRFGWQGIRKVSYCCRLVPPCVLVMWLCVRWGRGIPMASCSPSRIQNKNLKELFFSHMQFWEVCWWSVWSTVSLAASTVFSFYLSLRHCWGSSKLPEMIRWEAPFWGLFKPSKVRLSVEGSWEGHVIEGSLNSVRSRVGLHPLDAVLCLVWWKLPPQLFRQNVWLQSRNRSEPHLKIRPQVIGRNNIKGIDLKPLLLVDFKAGLYIDPPCRPPGYGKSRWLVRQCRRRSILWS